MTCGVGHKHGSDLALPWLWHRLAAVTPLWLLAGKLPYAMGVALKSQKTNKQTKKNHYQNFPINNLEMSQMISFLPDVVWLFFSQSITCLLVSLEVFFQSKHQYFIYFLLKYTEKYTNCSKRLDWFFTSRTHPEFNLRNSISNTPETPPCRLSILISPQR